MKKMCPDVNYAGQALRPRSIRVIRVFCGQNRTGGESSPRARLGARSPRLVQSQFGGARSLGGARRPAFTVGIGGGVAAPRQRVITAGLGRRQQAASAVCASPCVSGGRKRLASCQKPKARRQTILYPRVSSVWGVVARSRISRVAALRSLQFQPAKPPRLARISLREAAAVAVGDFIKNRRKFNFWHI